MATKRMVSANFWSDPYIEELDAMEKYFYLYLLTNPHTNIAGIYEISMKRIELESRLDPVFIAKTMAKFAADGKIYYEKNWLVLRNFVKHQVLNPSVKEGISRIISQLPQWLQDRLVENPQKDLFTDTIDTLGTDSPQPVGLNLTKLNLIKPNGNAPKPKTINVDEKATSTKGTASQSKIDSVRETLAAKGIVRPKGAVA